jgi:Zn-dependent M28 family amino/carboxypeptidase
VIRRLLFASLAALMPAVAAAQARPASPDAISARMMQRLSILAADSMEGRRAGSAGSARARAWIIGELAAMGAKAAGTSFEQRISLRPRPGSTDTVGANIVARIPGTKGSGPVLVLSAHYDHLGVRNGEVFNGADDDASGCIALLTIAEQLLASPPTHDVILAFFDAEETGMVGSRAFVNAPPVPLERIGANLNLDMVGRQDGGALWVSGTAHHPTLKPLAEAAAQGASVTVRFGHDTKGGKPGDDWTNSSDHAAFHAKGIPFLYLGVEDHADYHKAGDDVEKIDPAFFRGTVAYAAALLRQLDRSLPTIAAGRK